ncbi:aminotransferase class III-fold pyridoxal phosphate-dependent enzyme [Thermoleophilia bacterium SCSIO 60948]|nr:aminotransferase class III-fold pyridoxal phosphate-dependent enzyme [Thermoleophilia bacterium SCSIO 60948]
MDAVLETDPPDLTADDAVEIAASLFGLRAGTARDFGSERDRTFGLFGDAGELVAVLKVSNASEDADVLDMEAVAALHVIAVDPGLRVAMPWRPAASGDPGPARPGDEPGALRARWAGGGGEEHWVRLYEALPGNSRIVAADLSDAALGAWGETAARLGLALRGFEHPRAHRRMLWDIQHALDVRPMVDAVADPESRAIVARVLDEFERRLAPEWPRLRAQVEHTDLGVDNTITDDAGRITGVIDFGDMSYTALLADLASVVDSVAAGRDGDEMLRAARLVVDGYQRRTPLEEIELELLGVAWATRSAITIAIKSWRAAEGYESADVAEEFAELCLPMLRTLEATGWERLAREFGAVGTRRPDGSLAARRAAAFGPTMEPLFYDEPVEVASAEGVWITDTAGRRLLDAYNNVPAIGHAHPRVTTAIARQARRINTHTRYLHPDAIELAERLTATCPPELDTVLFVNSGSEANDLAWRIATQVTGARGGLCTQFAYHGITEATAALSPEGWAGTRPAHVETWRPPDTLRGSHLDGSDFAAAVARLGERDLGLAAAILDGVLTSDGILDPDPGYVQALLRTTREAGGLWIADEVQAGHGRTGEALWCFERFGVVPDFVTLGKPMGNGHPVAALITRSAILSELPSGSTLFSTFGGNPVSAAAALAVLDVIADERVIERTDRTGRALRDALGEVAASHPEIADVRGVGLAIGVEFVGDRSSLAPDGDRAKRVRDAMRELGVLVGTTGMHANVLKIRPPLALTEAEVPVLVGALESALSRTES